MMLQISDELASVIQREAKTRGKSVEDFLRAAVQRERTITERQKIAQEQEWWENLPLTERAEYAGEYVAVHQQQLVDHDKNAAQLYTRVREKYEQAPVLIMPAEGPREIRIYSPRIVSK